MRLKDISLNEKVKAISDNFQRQIDEAQARYEKLFQEKNQEVKINLYFKNLRFKLRAVQYSIMV